jgi:4-hydroxy-3-methylbut-2-enyl diphosphate reductase
MALAWAMVSTVIPRTAYDPGVDAALGLAFAFVSGLVFIRSAISDILDIQSDMLIGRETIPVLMGREKTKRLLDGITLVLSLVLALAWPAGWSPSLAFVLIPTVFYVWICLKVYDRKPGLSGALMRGFWVQAIWLRGQCLVVGLGRRHHESVERHGGKP